MLTRALTLVVLIAAAVLIPAAILFWLLNVTGIAGRTSDRIVAELEWLAGLPWAPWAAVAAVLVGAAVAFALLSGPARERPLLLIDRISAWVGKLFAWYILLLTFAVCYEVVARKLFRSPTTWAYDMSYILYGGLFLMAGAYTLSRNSHVRGDFLYRTWRPRVQAGLDLALYLLFFFPGVTALIYSGIGFAQQSWGYHEHSAFSPSGPPIYTFKALIPIAGGLLFIQGIAEVIRCVICLRTGTWPQRQRDVEELEKIILEDAQHRQEADAALEDRAAAERAAR